MTFGVVTDAHLGIHDERETKRTVLARLAEQFEENDVETVLFLGDLVHESGAADEKTLLEQVYEPFEGFDCYATTGNHDVIDLPRAAFEDVFDAPTTTVVERTSGVSLVLADSAATSEYDNIGRIDPEAFAVLEDELASGNDVVLGTHFPPQHTSFLPQFFHHYPEGAYPVNKLQLEETVADTAGTLTHILCGHLHPARTERFVGQPLDIPMTVFEPVQSFQRPYEGSLQRPVNTRIDVAELVFDLQTIANSQR